MPVLASEDVTSGERLFGSIPLRPLAAIGDERRRIGFTRGCWMNQFPPWTNVISSDLNPPPEFRVIPTPVTITAAFTSVTGETATKRDIHPVAAPVLYKCRRIQANITASPPINESTDETAVGEAALYYRIGVDR
jgi:hypothetical protein